MFYIFNQQGELISTADFELNDEDLASRGESAVESEAIFINPVLVNGEIVERGIAPSGYHVWDGSQWQLDEAKAAELKAQQQAEMRAKINALRDEKINGGVYVEPLDKWIDSDATAERNLLSVKASFDLMGDMEIAWTCADNSILMLNKEKLLLIWAVLMKEKTSNHANALKHKAAMEQADNPLEYDYSGGWSKTYGEFLAENATEKGAK